MNIFDLTIHNQMTVLIISKDKAYIKQITTHFKDTTIVKVKGFNSIIDAVPLLEKDRAYKLFIFKPNTPIEKEDIQEYFTMPEDFYCGVLLYQNENAGITRRLNSKTAYYLETHFYFFRGKDVIQLLQPKQ